MNFMDQLRALGGDHPGQAPAPATPAAPAATMAAPAAPAPAPAPAAPAPRPGGVPMGGFATMPMGGAMSLMQPPGNMGNGQGQGHAGLLHMLMAMFKGQGLDKGMGGLGQWLKQAQAGGATPDQMRAQVTAPAAPAAPATPAAPSLAATPPVAKPAQQPTTPGWSAEVGEASKGKSNPLLKNSYNIT